VPSYVVALAIMAIAVALTYAVAYTFGSKTPYIYKFLYLLAIMACAWLGYGPGALACLLATFLIPYLFIRGFRVSNVDLGPSALTLAVSILISRISSDHRRIEMSLRQANEKLDEQVRQRTAVLAESERRFRTVADAAPVLIWSSTPDKLCDYFNKPWLEFTGRTLEQELSNGWMEDVHPDDLERICAIYTTSVDARRPFSMEYRLRRNDGQYRLVVDNGVPRLSVDGAFDGYIGSCFDITERKEASARLQEAAKLESLGVLAGGIAHDFNNLLLGILGNSSLASEMLPPVHPARAILDDVVSASEKAAALIRQMLAYAGKVRFVGKAIDLSELVREIGRMVQVTIPKNVHLRFELATDLPPIDGDPSQIQQVIMNLVINGVEACDPELGGSVTVATFVQPVEEEYSKTVFAAEALSPGNYVCLEVQDTGCGMDEQTQAKIFDPFFTTKFTGRGLGLSAVIGIVRGHKGAIKVYSTPGKGAAFKVLLPVVSEMV
jgi:PAS domain S-box-containing protein